MYAVNFEYNGQFLSDFGFIVCDFGDSLGGGADTISAGSQITFNKQARHYGKDYVLANTQYDECVTATFDICKDPEAFNKDEMEIASFEFREIMRWLNRGKYLKFRVLDKDHFGDVCYFDASFNLQKILISERLYGIRLTMESNRPYGYGEETRYVFDVDNVKKTYIVNDKSDEIGYVYPNMIITCKQDGDLKIYNDLLDSTMELKNCKNGEVITINGKGNVITSSNPTHKVYEDFNYKFLKIGNTYDEPLNRLTFSIKCNAEINYYPTIKDVP